MFSLPSPPVPRKRKSNPNTPLSSNKRARLIGIFEPRCIVPTGARRSWTFAKEPRYILDPVTQGTKRSLSQDGELPNNCKVRVLDNRDALFLPSYKRLSSPKKPHRKRTPSSSPARKSIEFVRLRRREFIRQRQLQRVDSGICMEYDEDPDQDILLEPMVSGEDFKLFDGADASTFTGFSVEMMETTETTATDHDMEIEDASVSTTTTIVSTTEGDADSGSTAAEQTSEQDEEKKEAEKGMSVDKEEEKGSSSDVEVEDAEKKISEQKEANTKLSSKDTIVKERIRKRLGADELVRLGSSASKKGDTKKAEEDEEDEEPPRRSTRRKSSKLSLPATVEEEEEDEKEREDDDDVVAVVKRKSSRNSSKSKEEEKEDESEKETEKKEEKKEKKKLVRRKVKVEESGSESDESEREDKKKSKKKVVKEAEKIQEEAEEQVGDKMEEDTDEDSNSSGEDTDMSTDEDITEAAAEDIITIVVEEVIEEDVTMSEDDEMTEESPEEVSEKKDTKEEVDAETTAKDTEEVKDVEVVTNGQPESNEEDQEKQLQEAAATGSGEVKKSVRRLVLAPSKMDELEAAKMLLVPRTPRTPRSPNMSRFNITMSKAPRKLNPLMNPLMSPRRNKFNKSDDLSAHWAMKRLAVKKRQQPFNPANISRHAYRDPINEDELYNLAARKALWEDDEAEEAYADEQYLRVEWTCTTATKSWDGRYSSWMVENGSALMEFCVRKLEGFNMGW